MSSLTHANMSVITDSIKHTQRICQRRGAVRRWYAPMAPLLVADADVFPCENISVHESGSHNRIIGKTVWLFKYSCQNISWFKLPLCKKINKWLFIFCSFLIILMLSQINDIQARSRQLLDTKSLEWETLVSLLTTAWAGPYKLFSPVQCASL